LFLLASLNVSGFLFYIKALGLADATRVVPLMQTNILFTVLAGIYFLNEKEHTVRKIIAGALALIGAYFLV
jgi:uncharacterized membrane protein